MNLVFRSALLRVCRPSSLFHTRRSRVVHWQPARGMADLVFTHPIPGGVGPNGEENLEYTFESEPLGLPPDLGYGFAQLRFGDAIGPDARYTVVRKLGWGMHSSTWLVRDAKFVRRP